jgi:hypothetical protein
MRPSRSLNRSAGPPRCQLRGHLLNRNAGGELDTGLVAGGALRRHDAAVVLGVLRAGMSIRLRRRCCKRNLREPPLHGAHAWWRQS